jgi:hypothetical protein
MEKNIATMYNKQTLVFYVITKYMALLLHNFTKRDRWIKMSKNVKFKLWLFGFFILGSVCVVTCEAGNYFGEKRNQLSIYVGQEFSAIYGKSLKTEPLCSVNFVYSQPNTFFRVPGRQNFEILGFFAYDYEYKKYNRLTAGLSQDIIIPVYKCVFFGLGTGIFISQRTTEKVSSRFIFGQKAFVGIKFDDEIVELVVRHFSNGDLTPQNSGYNFIGIVLAHNF